MCPPAPASTARRPSSTTARAACSTVGHPASSTAGSRLPCNAFPASTRAGRVDKRRPPIDSDHRRAGARHGAQQFGGADAEVRHRDTAVGQRGEHPCAVRQHVPAVVGQRQHAGPRIEHLNRVHPGVELNPQERDGEVGQLLHQRVPARRFGQHHRLRPGVIAAWATFDQIGRQGERRAGEPDQRNIAQRRARAARPHPIPVARLRVPAVSPRRRRRRCAPARR